MSLSSPLIASQTSAIEEGEDDDVRIVPGTWYRLESDIITVLFPAGGQKPMFIWWHTNKPDQIYVVKFQGLVEWFAFAHPMLPKNPDYYNHMRDASEETWSGMAERVGMSEMMRNVMLQMLAQMELKWHSPLLNFGAARWTLIKPENITTSGGKVIGVSFGFNLTNVPYQPRFEFAKNNILIRVRFYNETVEETVPGTDYKYTVNAGEMKMDLVVNKWEWNIDALKELIQRLRDEGFDITIPEGKSRLALWVNLASINVTKLPLAREEPEEIEYHSTATHMEIEDEREDITANRTGTETELERPIEIARPIIKIRFSNETDTLGGFFRFVSSAKVSGYPEIRDVNMVPVKAAYIAAGAHMRLFLGYPYFGNGTLEHDPSIGVDTTSVDMTPKYAIQAPSGSDITPTVIGAYIPPLFSPPLMLALIAVISATAIVLYAIKWRRKTPVNMVGVGK